MVSEEYSKRIEADIELADALDDEEEEANSGEGPGNLYEIQSFYA